jgi:hypothetical protein
VEKLRSQATTRIAISRGIHLSSRGSHISLAPEPSKNLFRKRRSEAPFLTAASPAPIIPDHSPQCDGREDQMCDSLPDEQRVDSPKGRHPGFADCTFLLPIDTRLIT